MRQPATKKWPVLGSIVLLFFFFVFFLTLTAYHFGVLINLSPSMPVGLYLETHEPITRRSIVAVCLEKQASHLALSRGYLKPGRCASGSEPVLKKVGAILGDVLEITALGVEVNGVKLPHTAPLKTDSKKLPLKPRLGRFVVKKNEVWLFSTHDKKSFDSRYFGPVRKGAILSTIKPLVVFG